MGRGSRAPPSALTQNRLTDAPGLKRSSSLGGSSVFSGGVTTLRRATVRREKGQRLRRPKYFSCSLSQPMGSVAAFVFLLVGLLFPAALAFTLTLRCIRRLGRRLLLGRGGPLRLLVLLCGCWPLWWRFILLCGCRLLWWRFVLLCGCRPLWWRFVLLCGCRLLWWRFVLLCGCRL